MTHSRLLPPLPPATEAVHNLRAHRRVTVEVGTDRHNAIAVDVTGEDRDRVYAEQARRYSGFGEYAKKTRRVIPVVELERAN